MFFYNCRIIKEPFTLDTRPVQNDDRVEYDLTEHRYILKDDYFQTKTGINLTDRLGSDTEAQIFLDEDSEKLYDMVFDSYEGDTQYREESIRIKEYLMANDLTKLDTIVKALVSFARASINTDIDRVGDEHGINFETMTRLNFEKWDDLPKQTKRQLKKADLLFSGEYQQIIEDEEYRNGY